VASALLALLVGAAFVVLARAVSEEGDSSDQAIRSQEMIAAASRLERLVLDLESGQRGYLVAREERFLESWGAARDEYRRAADALVASTGGVNGQAHAAREIADAVDAYVTQYSVPLVEAARRGEASASSANALDEGKRRVDAIRAVRRLRGRRATPFSSARRGRRLRRSPGDTDRGARFRRIDPAHLPVRRLSHASGRASRSPRGDHGRAPRWRRPVDADARDRDRGGRRARALLQHDGGLARGER
jgi:CHASE3 domain sensor protein